MTPQIGWLHRIFRSSSAGSLLRLQASVNHAANVQCRSVFNKLPSACTIYFSTATSSRKLLVCQHEHSGYRNFTRSTTAYQNAKAEKLAADQLIKKKRSTAEAANLRKFKKEAKVVTIWKNMTVTELANAMGKDLDHVFEAMLYVENSDKYDQPSKHIDNIKVIQDIIKRSGMRCVIGAEPSTPKTHKEFKDAVKRPPPGPETALVPRHPVVTIMGHVDHGKTTLLDSLRNTRVVDSEFGGITQHIGAFQVVVDDGNQPGQKALVTFLDTPGHAAFTAMRARGANVTDIVVLVVAADDGVMEQTTESIRLAKEAKVPIIVAINKMDKPQADLERTKRMLMAQELILEDAGGLVQYVPISALKGTGLPQLIEAIHTEAALLDLKMDPKGLVEATVIESRTDPHRGKLSTAIVQRGTLRRGSILVAGTAWAKVRAMFDHQGRPIQQAAPSTPVEILGWRELPSAGDEILEVESERRAHEVVAFRQSMKMKEKSLEDLKAIEKKVEEHLREYKPALEKKRSSGQYGRYRNLRVEQKTEEKRGPKLSIIIKGDVDGSVEALLDVLDSYTSKKCELDVIHYGVGPVSEGDIKLAEPFGAIIYAFNVGVVSPSVRQLVASSASGRGPAVQLREHNIIYRLFEDLRDEMEKLLPPIDVEEVIGEANVLQQFLITEGKRKVPVAGCRCLKGMLRKDSLFRLIRGQETIFDGKLNSMKHLKNEVETIKKDVECGVQLGNLEIKPKAGDTLICYRWKQVPQKIDWDTGF